MATHATYVSVPNVRGYNSTRVFDGVRQLDAAATQRHRARLKKALEMRKDCAES